MTFNPLLRNGPFIAIIRFGNSCVNAFSSIQQPQLQIAFPAASLDWIPLACVIVFVAAFSLGLNPISWLLVGEVFPLEYRSLGTSLATAFSYVCAFVGVKTFVDLRVSMIIGKPASHVLVAFSAILQCGSLSLQSNGQGRERHIDFLNPLVGY